MEALLIGVCDAGLASADKKGLHLDWNHLEGEKVQSQDKASAHSMIGGGKMDKNLNEMQARHKLVWGASITQPDRKPIGATLLPESQADSLSIRPQISSLDALGIRSESRVSRAAKAELTTPGLRVASDMPTEVRTAGSNRPAGRAKVLSRITTSLCVIHLLPGTRSDPAKRIAWREWQMDLFAATRACPRSR